MLISFITQAYGVENICCILLGVSVLFAVLSHVKLLDKRWTSLACKKVSRCLDLTLSKQIIAMWIIRVSASHCLFVLKHDGPCSFIAGCFYLLSHFIYCVPFAAHLFYLYYWATAKRWRKHTWPCYVRLCVRVEPLASQWTDIEEILY
jgi:hypothetical protein